MDSRIKKIEEAASYIEAQPGYVRPVAGIILGSGLGKLADRIDTSAVIPYDHIPCFVKATAIGHKGNLIFGKLAGKPVCAMQGRFHYYEGHTMEDAVLPVRVMKRLGVDTIFISNAAGGINKGFKVGDLMIIEDHINLLPNPLIGPNLNEYGERFPDMTCAYDRELIAKAEQAAAEMKIKVRKGVYLANTGPSFETPAEIRFYRLAGADAVGMSTVHEVITARHCGMRVFAMSVISNIANDTTSSSTFNDSGDVIAAADTAGIGMSAIFDKLIESL